jgi:hypothetical protein
LIGVWSRRSIRWPDGREDLTTRVWWVQGRTHFVDIRIPAERPSFAGIRSLGDCDPEQRAWLSRQEGFAGTLEVANGAWLWNRWLDFNPPTGKRDIGRLIFADEHKQMMIEEGVDESYTEVWERIDDAASTNGEAFVMRLRSEREVGMLVAVGRHFILAIDNRKIDGSDHQIHPFNVEISHGIRTGPISEWIVSDSACFWREGTSAFGDSKLNIDWSKRELIGSRSWEILEPPPGHQCDFIF